MELEWICDRLERRAPDEPIVFGEPPAPELTESERDRVIDRGIRIARYIGGELDEAPEDRTPAGIVRPAKPRPRSRVDFGAA